MSETKKRHNVPPPLRHYADWDAPGGRRVAAVCRALIRRVEHDNEPTCPTCRAVLAEREAQDA